MRSPSEIVDETFGVLSLIDESAYFAEVPWNRGLNIRLFIHVDGENHRKCIGEAKSTFSSARNNEMELLSQGLDYLYSNGDIDKSDDDDLLSWLQDAAETSIEIYSNGEGRLVYLVMMVGTVIITFSHDARFQSAQAIAG